MAIPANLAEITDPITPKDMTIVQPEDPVEEQEQEQEQDEEEQDEEEQAEEEQDQEQKQSVVTSPPLEEVKFALEPGLEPAQSDSDTKSVIKKSLRPKTRSAGIYSLAVITRRIAVRIENVGRTIKQNLETLVASEIEGKCIVEGFIKPQSTRLLTYNSGLIRNGQIVFEVVFECMACCPVEGMLIDCIAKNITKAGIRAEINDDVSPVVVFVARDHNHLSDYFSSITENTLIKVRVIGQRFELNDKYVSVIAEIVEQKQHIKSRKSKPKLIFPK